MARPLVKRPRDLHQIGQGELFGDNYAQPDSAAAEPVFWSDGAGPSTPDDDFVQADAPDCANQRLSP
ncbi:MAG: hypothetical protein FJ399_00795 [Verrucomicrobia bacterium]|nr:hypothetical protein [Verrucomicrobiota bacterium]